MTHSRQVFKNISGRLVTSLVIGCICLFASAQESAPETNFIDYTRGAGQSVPSDSRIKEGVWETPRWSIKTNAFTWMATIPNLTGELKVSEHVALDLGLWWCPWKISERYSLKTFAILPEGRWWFNPEAYGHYVNIHLTVAWYNLRWKDSRYQDSHRPLLGAGLGYGYQFRFNENWGLDLCVGVGYLNLRYDVFYNVENGAMIDKRKMSYWGIDRLGVSLVYSFSQ